MFSLHRGARLTVFLLLLHVASVSAEVREKFLAVEFSPGGDILYASTNLGNIYYYDVKTRKLLTSATNGTRHVIESLDISPDGKLLACSGWDKWQLWDGSSGKHLADLASPSSTTFVTFTEDGKWLASLSGGDPKIWEVSGRKGKAIFEGQGSFLKDGAFSPDGRLLATCNSDGTWVWDVKSGNTVAKLKSEDEMDSWETLAFSPDGKLLATGGGGKFVLWQVGSWKKLHQGKHNEYKLTDLCFTPDGKTLVTCGWMAVRLWDVASGKHKFLLEHESWLKKATTHPQGKILALISGSEIFLWDMDKKELQAKLEMPKQ